MRKSTTNLIKKIKDVSVQYSILNDRKIKTKRDENKVESLGSEINEIAEALSVLFDIDFGIRKINLEKEKTEFIEKKEVEFSDRMIIEENLLKEKHEFQRLWLAAQYQKIKNNSALTALKIMDVIKKQTLNDIDSSLNFIAENNSDLLKENVLTDVLKIEGVYLDKKGMLYIPADISKEMKNQLAAYHFNVTYNNHTLFKEK